MRTLVLALVALSASSCIERRDYAVGADAGDPDAPSAGGTITVAVIGPGRVTADRRGIDCPGECVATYPPDGTVTLFATADANAVFKEWGGDCVDDGPCVLDTTSAHAVTASFVAVVPVWRLSVTLAGTGTGAVTSTPSGINCGASCATTFTDGTQVTLTPMATGGSVFTGWSGACNGVGACVVPMTMAREVTATFAPAALRNLQVLMSGSGSGNVSSTPTGIDCSSGTCNAPFPDGSTVQLIAIAAAGSTFVGWGGACNGVFGPVCNVTMSGARSVIADFDPVAVITMRVADQGTVAAQVPPLAGPSTCTHATDPCMLTYRVGTAVSFVATPAAGYHFDSFVSTVCQASPSNCAFTVVGPDQVDAFFCPTGSC